MRQTDTDATQVKTAMFRTIALAPDTVIIMDGGIHGVQGHTIVASGSGPVRWKRTVESIFPSDKEGSGEIALSTEERDSFERWAEHAWQVAGPDRHVRFFTSEQLPPHWVWVIAIRRGEEVRLLEGGGFTSEGLPSDVAAFLDWLRKRVDAAAGCESVPKPPPFDLGDIFRT